MQKFFKKGMALLAVIVISISMLTGCSKEEIGADTVTKAMFDLFVLRDAAACEEIGISQEAGEEVISSQKQATIESFKGLLSSLGSDVPDDKIEEIDNAQVEALRKITYEIEEVSSEKDKKVIKISTTYVDTSSLGNNASKKVEDKIKSGEITDVTKLGEALADSLIEEIQNSNVSEDKKSFEAEFELREIEIDGKNKKIWFPVDSAEFSVNLSSAVAGR